MKGVIFTLKNRRQRRGLPAVRLPNIENIRSILRRRGTLIFFVSSMLLGLFFGSASVSSLSSKTLKTLDLLFTTNLPERLKNGIAGAFCASFASDFIFLFISVLCALSLWGVIVLPFIAFFKGFGIGVSAAYLISSYGIKGALFYFLIILPGVFFFSMILVHQLSACYYIFKKLFFNVTRARNYNAKENLGLFLKKSLIYLMWTLIASFADALLWCVFAGLFKF
ncbi:MAG: hypothetical protein J1E41_06465 [Ruminococcus sp.]|nr:hypothetical protein [Ruminococcus sp.]